MQVMHHSSAHIHSLSNIQVLEILEYQMFIFQEMPAAVLICLLWAIQVYKINDISLNVYLPFFSNFPPFITNKIMEYMCNAM